MYSLLNAIIFWDLQIDHNLHTWAGTAEVPFNIRINVMGAVEFSSIYDGASKDTMGGESISVIFIT